MKYLKLIVLLAFAPILSCNSQISNNGKVVPIKGLLTNAKSQTKIYIDDLGSEAASTVDSAVIDDKGNFSFKPKVAEAGFYRIRIDQQNFFNLLIDTLDKPEILGDASTLPQTYTVKGSATSELLWELNSNLSVFYKETDKLQKTFDQYRTNPNVNVDSLTKTLQADYLEMNSRKDKYTHKFIADHPTSLVSLAAIGSINIDSDFPTYNQLDKTLYPAHPKSKYVIDFHQKVTGMLKLNVGAEAPDFEANDPLGHPIKLSSYRGKVVLVDFWASWCGPCRAENPNVVKAFQKYHAKGFEVLGVSLDKDKAKWEQAIQADGLTWRQVSDLSQWNSNLAKLYNVTSIPTNFLLDKNGVILGKSLRGQDLERKLDEIFNK